MQGAVATLGGSGINLARTADREERFNFGPDYMETGIQVVYRRGQRRPRSMADLAGLKLETKYDLRGLSNIEALEWSMEHYLPRYLKHPQRNEKAVYHPVELWQYTCAMADYFVATYTYSYYLDGKDHPEEAHRVIELLEQYPVGTVADFRSDRQTAPAPAFLNTDT